MKEVAGELISRKAALLIKAPVLPKEAKQLSEEVEQQVTRKHLRKFKTLVKGKDPALRINTKRAGEMWSEDAETARERPGFVRQ